MRTWITAAVVALMVMLYAPGPQARGDEATDESPKVAAKEPASPQPPASTPEKKPATPPDKSPLSPPDQPVTYGSV